MNVRGGGGWEGGRGEVYQETRILVADSLVGEKLRLVYDGFAKYVRW